MASLGDRIDAAHHLETIRAMPYMNKLDFTYSAGSPVYGIFYDLLEKGDKVYRVRLWKLGCVMTCVGIKTNSDEDFIYLVDYGDDGKIWCNLSELKDARMNYQPEMEILQEAKEVGRF